MRKQGTKIKIEFTIPPKGSPQEKKIVRAIKALLKALNQPMTMSAEIK